MMDDLQARGRQESLEREQRVGTHNRASEPRTSRTEMRIAAIEEAAAFDPALPQAHPSAVKHPEAPQPLTQKNGARSNQIFPQPIDEEALEAEIRAQVDLEKELEQA